MARDHGMNHCGASGTGGMHMRLMFALLLSVAALSSVLPAQAGNYRLIAGESVISFTYLENGTPKPGAFTRLEGHARFSFRRPSEADVELVVHADSVDLGDPVRTHFAQSIDWFWAERYPVFTFRLRELKHLGGPRYRAIGTVSIKERELEVSVDLELARLDHKLRASGALVLDRHDYGLGIGFSSLFATIGREVRVRFELTGAPE